MSDATHLPSATASEKAAHTPGPWRVYHADFGEGCIEIGVTTVSTEHIDSDGDGADICEMQNEGYFGKEQVEANARLIAAAPQLLALAQRYASECAECGGRWMFPTHREDPGGHMVLECWECADIRAAIAEAYGLTAALSTQAPEGSVAT